MVVLGSGGHTTEMLKLLQGAPTDVYAPLHYVIAATDHTSADRIPHADAAPGSAATVVHTVPRSREVGQGWASTCATTAVAMLRCAWLVACVRPDVLIVNGPGTCVPICACVFALKVVAIRPRAKLVFVESFCRVETLSLTGWLLYPLADRFLVHWPELAAKYPRAEYVGRFF
ncbi:beta-N-acetylglucosaminyltransferase [Tribonema minus]|uniref:UDP-N-acetylglucosamine transferase subunit ALG14 n=1 Tax=Tribonema minus TaxID=303371 RepID=A0A835YPL6_9STRA|nr:beta-N-acetylglucosaminyltransferase [Tribonema minus]